jgi:hypothetical protein
LEKRYVPPLLATANLSEPSASEPFVK